MNSYWSLACRDSVPSAGDSPVSKPSRTMLSDENKYTATQEAKPQPSILFNSLTALGGQGFSDARSHFQSLLSIELLC